MSEVHSTGALRQQPEAVDQDRELLELAALAAGLTGEWSTTIGGWPCLIQRPYTQPWQPLHDDGDALRLAVKLRIEVVIFSDTVVPSRAASWKKGAAHCSLWEPESDDPFAAARRAIVRAAAAIGSEIQQTASGSHQEARSNEQGEST